MPHSTSAGWYRRSIRSIGVTAGSWPSPASVGRRNSSGRLPDLGCDIVATRAFADHQPYDPDTVMRLIDEAAATSALLVTTEKDYFRLPPAGRDVAVALPVRLEFSDTDAVDRLLARLPRVRT